MYVAQLGQEIVKPCTLKTLHSKCEEISCNQLWWCYCAWCWFLHIPKQYSNKTVYVLYVRVMYNLYWGNCASCEATNCIARHAHTPQQNAAQLWQFVLCTKEVTNMHCLQIPFTTACYRVCTNDNLPCSHLYLPHNNHTYMNWLESMQNMHTGHVFDVIE